MPSELPSFDLGLNWHLFSRPKIRLWAWPEPRLPYAFDHLEPVLDRKAVTEHVDSFAMAYVRRFNRALEYGVGGRRALKFNWGGMVLHHLFFWGMENAGSRPAEQSRLDQFLSYRGGVKGTIDQLVDLSQEQEGSGWLCLTFNPKNTRIELLLLPNQDVTPLRDRVPLVVVDLWEHSFLEDYRARRAVYTRDVLQRLVDWDLADRRLEAALGRSNRILRLLKR